jgi:hypothetical protein
MRPLMALTHLGRGDTCLKHGIVDEACRELLTALRLFDEMNMPLWHGRAMRALRSISPPH